MSYLESPEIDGMEPSKIGTEAEEIGKNGVHLEHTMEKGETKTEDLLLLLDEEEVGADDQKKLTKDIASEHEQEAQRSGGGFGIVEEADVGGNLENGHLSTSNKDAEDRKRTDSPEPEEKSPRDQQISEEIETKGKVPANVQLAGREDAATKTKNKNNAGGGGGGVEDRKRRDSWKSHDEGKKIQKEAGVGESHGDQPRKLTAAAPKKVAQKVNSIIKDYTTKMTSTDTEAATPKRRIRRSETDTKGHISEIRERIERSASTVHPATPRGSAGTGGKQTGTGDGSAPPLEEKRRKKAEEWMNKVVKTNSENSPLSTPSRSSVFSPPGRAQTSAWKKKEEEMKIEREKLEAAEKELEEKRKKSEEERRSARESARKQKVHEETAKREQQQRTQKSTTTATSSSSERKDPSQHTVAERYTRSLQSSATTRSSPLKSLSSGTEDDREKKRRVLECRIRPLNLEGLSPDDLEKKAHELHERIRILEEEKYDLEVLLEKKEIELNNLKVKTGDAKGKFVKPPLKKVTKKEETFSSASNGDALFTFKPTADVSEPQITKATSEDEPGQLETTMELQPVELKTAVC